jgi:MazG family protein
MHDISKLYDIVKKLRAPEGCPWDKEQTFDSLTPHVIEEAYELVDALQSGDKNELIEELGDVLLHVVMIATMAEENQLFLFSDVLSQICTKMIHRHPHVFGDKKVNSVDEVWQQWEQLKTQEKEDQLTMDTIPKQLPALAKAYKIQKRASRLGFDWPDITGTLDKVKEEIAELEEAIASKNKQLTQEEAGDLLFAFTNTLRKLEIDPEAALQCANKKFQDRFNHIEIALKDENKQFQDESLDELTQRWETAKNSI